MPFVHGEERGALAAVAALTDCNPFLRERVDLEKQILGPAFQPFASVWSADGDAGVFDPNLPRLRERVEQLVGDLHKRPTDGAAAAAEEIADYRRAVFYLLWLRYEDDWGALIKAADAERAPARKVGCYERFAADCVEFLSPLGDERVDPAHLFALGFQLRRAFHHIFRKIFGATLPAARLRAAVWQSIFTRDASRYRAGLHDRMADIPTLITGESGTGKELVARAIALSQFIPFDPSSQTFATDHDAGFAAVNLSALNPTLIESELFGHRRGAFTGAVEDRAGWFERCGPHGAVFLDEIGELDASIQVKLLRVLQSREFHRIGETEPRRFTGKVIAATHRSLEQGIAAGRFRQDLYYRICADLIQMPTLREQIAASPADLRSLVLIVAQRVAGAEHAEELADEVERWGSSGSTTRRATSASSSSACETFSSAASTARAASSPICPTRPTSSPCGFAAARSAPTICCSATSRWSTPRPRACRRPPVSSESTGVRCGRSSVDSGSRTGRKKRGLNRPRVPSPNGGERTRGRDRLGPAARGWLPRAAGRVVSKGSTA